MKLNRKGVSESKVALVNKYRNNFLTLTKHVQLPPPRPPQCFFLKSQISSSGVYVYGLFLEGKIENSRWRHAVSAMKIARHVMCRVGDFWKLTRNAIDGSIEEARLGWKIIPPLAIIRIISFLSNPVRRQIFLC